MNDREKLQKIKNLFPSRLDDGQKLENIKNILRINRTTKDDNEDLKEIEKIMLGRKWRIIRSGYPERDKLKMILEVLHYDKETNDFTY